MISIFKKNQPSVFLTVPYTKDFRGYKRIKVATFEDKEAQKGIDKVIRQPSIKEISFEKIPKYDGLIVYADGNKIGTIWKHSWEEYYKAITGKKVSAAHVQFANDVHLFIKI
jgi:hypothetical protein